MKLSVALVTRNRPDSLTRCLESLRAQDTQPFEVVISDDSDDLLELETRALAERFNCSYMRGPRRGLYANRNHAALACGGTHIRTMDDDHTFPDDHFEKCLDACNRDPTAIWTTGEITYVADQLFGTFETANQLGPAGVGYPIIDYEDNWGIADGSSIYPVAVFDRGYRMEEIYGYGPSYLEFGAFLYAKGFRSRCLANAPIVHHAKAETITRVPDSKARESQLFAAICFNVYFRPSVGRMAGRIASVLVRSSGRDARLIARAWHRARRRWNTRHSELPKIP